MDSRVEKDVRAGRACLECGYVFAPEDEDQKYCDRHCREFAERRAKREATERSGNG